MRIPDDTICKVCQGIFCCVECRHKHELKNHAAVVCKPTVITKENIKSDASENVKSTKADLNTIFFFCPICENRPLVLKAGLQNKILSHMESHHLPLRCNKCFKTYNNVNDLKEFSNCRVQNCISLSSNQSCFSQEASKVTVTKAAELPRTMISQSSPLTRQDVNESQMTPISIINMRWKAKSKLTQEEFISDSVSSIKNISSISNSSLSRSTETTSTVKGKVTRCSSTPVQLEMVFAKPKEQTFNATGGHMSSIQYNSGCESDISPAFPQPNSQAFDPVNRYMRVAGSRPRMSAVTPLRQVMSKSIQKAFAEHGLPSTNSLKTSNTFQRKKNLDAPSPEVNADQSLLHPALDLRLSPAVRRSQSECEVPLKNRIFNEQRMEYNKFPNLRHEILLSAKKLTTESIVITRTEHLSSISSSTSAVSSNYSISSVKPYPTSTNSTYKSAESNRTGSSVFKSCSSVEIITATTEQIKHLESFDKENIKYSAMQPLTPITRIPGSVIHKKIIKFETPKTGLYDSHEFENSTSDMFFTPNATPINNNIESNSVETKRAKLSVKENLNGRFSPLRRPSIKECVQNTYFNRVENERNTPDDEHDISDEKDGVFFSKEPETSPQKLKDDKKENKIQQSGGLWSLMASVMRLPSFKGKKSVDSNSNYIIKRCASIAGSLVRSKSLVAENELSSLKRKRTYTTDNQSSSAYFAELNNVNATSPTSNLNNSSKRFRIQGRRPIDRMRLNS